MLPPLSSSFTMQLTCDCVKETFDDDMALCLEPLYIISENLSLCAFLLSKRPNQQNWNLTFDFCWNEDKPSLMFTHHSSFVLYELNRNKGVTNLLN